MMPSYLEEIHTSQVSITDSGMVFAHLGLPAAPENNRSRGAGLTLYDEEGRSRILLVMDSTGKPRIEILDERNQTVWRAP
jgi:hypothetical protein